MIFWLNSSLIVPMIKLLSNLTLDPRLYPGLFCEGGSSSSYLLGEVISMLMNCKAFEAETLSYLIIFQECLILYDLHCESALYLTLIPISF